MLKSILIYAITFLITAYVFFTIQSNYIETKNEILSYNLVEVYQFFVLSSLIICVAFKVTSALPQIKEQLGFIYLALIVVKIVLFSILFYDPVFTEVSSNFQKVTLLIPMGIFLVIEVFFVAKILNEKTI